MSAESQPGSINMAPSVEDLKKYREALREAIVSFRTISNIHPDIARAAAQDFNLTYFPCFSAFKDDTYEVIIKSPKGWRIRASLHSGLVYEIWNEKLVNAQKSSPGAPASAPVQEGQETIIGRLRRSLGL
jgi:hypothetical protein